MAKRVSKVWVIVFRPHGQADIFVFKDGSKEFSAFIDNLIDNFVGFTVANEVIECLGVSKKRKGV